jgi:hypothetical protein
MEKESKDTRRTIAEEGTYNITITLNKEILKVVDTTGQGYNRCVIDTTIRKI